jgi:hypothetical protein
MLVPVRTQELRVMQAIRLSVTPAGTLTTVDEAMPPLELSLTRRAPVATDICPTATHPDGPGQLTEYNALDPARADAGPGTPSRIGTTSPTPWLL